MNFKTKQFIRKRFADYYTNSKLGLPHEFTRREWGFIFFDELPEVVMRRHKAFSRENEALDYIRGMVPAHAYHSAAYYEFPGAGTMKEKKWQGADLIFDLDADHLPGKARSYAEMLSNVKSETGKLLDFLLDDFGFSDNYVSIVFSGGRGYHIHVRDPKVLALESAERREIVDYVSGTGLSVDFLFKQEKHILIDTGGKFKKKELYSPRKVTSFNETSEGFGWGKRISRYIINFMKDVSTKNDNDALNEITNMITKYNPQNLPTKTLPSDIVALIIQIKNENPKISNKKIAEEVGVSYKEVRDILITNDLKGFSPEAKKKLKKIRNLAQNPIAVNMIESKGIIDDPYLFDAIVQKAIEENSISLGSAHTDEPVTADIRRLIRLPSSLHGGSGMRVVPLSLSEFKNFDPLNDALVFSEKMVDIEVIPPLRPQNSKVEMKGKSYTVTEGKNTLPEYAAIYLMCRGAAEYA